MIDGPDPVAVAPAANLHRGRRWRRLALAGAAVAAGVLAALAGLAAWGGSYVAVEPAAAGVEEPRPADLERRLEHARRQLAARAPRGIYAVVDTHRNLLRLCRDGELLRQAVCSTGSGGVLWDRAGKRRWVFETPLGERRVERKVKDPVWIKPDWAFVEEGYEPPREARHRVDDVSLGEYALYLGDGYLIHGTLFQTLLGQRVTHGCIRLGDEDLEYVYRTLAVGARVYLY